MSCITGRRCPPEIIELADTVTEMTKIKHAFNAGVPAQRGIEDYGMAALRLDRSHRRAVRLLAGPRVR